MKKIFSSFFALCAATYLMAATYTVQTDSPNPTDNIRLTVRGRYGAAEGDTILLLTGEYIEEGSIVFSEVPNLVVMAAEGATPVIKQNQYMELHTSVKFIGIKFDGGNVAQYTASLYEDSHKNIVFENCEFTGAKRYNLSCSSNSVHVDSVVVNNCFFHDNGNAALYMVKTATLSDNRPTCDYMRVTNSTFANISALNGCAVIDVRNNNNSMSGDVGVSTELFVDHITMWNYIKDGSNNGGIMSYKSPRVTIQNSIIANPDSVTGMNATYCYGGSRTNCLVYNTTNRSDTAISVTGDLNGDPLFANAAALDFSLRIGSPAIGAATDGSNLGDPRWKIYYYITITDQDTDDALLESYNGKKANVEVIRPLVEGMTNTICLPFALNREQIDEAFGDGAEVWALTESTLSPDNMILDIEFDKVDAMSAGVPYLIEPGMGYNPAVNPVFEEIEMSKTLAPVEHANLDFIGTVQKSFVSVGYKDHLFVGADNIVFYPDASDYLNGMRAYFKIKYHEEAPVSAGVQARMILGRTTPTELQTPKATDSVRKVMINGRIHIIRNGRTNDILGNTIK